MSSYRFDTAAQAEAKFYSALESGDLQGMMAVWESSTAVVCIHPLGPRLQGIDQVRASWESIFLNNPRLKLVNQPVHIQEESTLSIHIVREHITVLQGSAPAQQIMLATNVYRLGAGGWRMIIHHASPEPMLAAAGQQQRLH